MCDKSNRTLISELRFFLKHVNKKHNEVIFQNTLIHRVTIALKIPLNPTNSSLSSNNLTTVITNRLPDPQISTDHTGHYKTFIEICELPTEEQVHGDEGMPTKLGSELGSFSICPTATLLKSILSHVFFKNLPKLQAISCL